MNETTPMVFRGPSPRSEQDLYTAWTVHGVRTIISLQEGWASIFDRLAGKWTEEKECWERMGGVYIHLPMSNLLVPSLFRTRYIYREMAKSVNSGCVLVHCYSGVDRTGWMCGIYKYWKNHYRTPQEAWDMECVAKGQHWWFRWWKPFFLIIAECG